MRELVFTLAFITGLVLVCAGLSIWSKALAMVFSGLVLIFLSYVVANATE